MCVFAREGCHKYGIIREYEDETGGSQPDARSVRAVIRCVKSEYERSACISDMHKFGVRVQRLI